MKSVARHAADWRIFLLIGYKLKGGVVMERIIDVAQYIYDEYKLQSVAYRQYSELPLMEILERIPRRRLKHSRRISASMMMMVAVARIHGRRLLTT